MKKIKPKLQSTRLLTDNHIWIPTNFDNFLKELNHIIESCSGNSQLPLFRGHRDAKWILESTFARTCKEILFNLEPHKEPSKHIRESIEYHRILLNILLLKFGVLGRPSEELEVLAQEKDIDSWFESMKRCQQYPNEDSPYLKGSFIMDWSKSKDVGIFFVNNNSKQDGALYICDTIETGKTWQIKKVGEILDIMNKKGNKGEALGTPLIFHPPKQIKQERANNQKAIYFAQMDLRYSFEYIWGKQEEDLGDSLIYIKLILPNGTQGECSEYLMEKGITESYLFPDLN